MKSGSSSRFELDGKLFKYMVHILGSNLKLHSRPLVIAEWDIFAEPM